MVPARSDLKFDSVLAGLYKYVLKLLIALAGLFICHKKHFMLNLLKMNNCTEGNNPKLVYTRKLQLKLNLITVSQKSNLVLVSV